MRAHLWVAAMVGTSLACGGGGMIEEAPASQAPGAEAGAEVPVEAGRQGGRQRPKAAGKELQVEVIPLGSMPSPLDEPSLEDCCSRLDRASLQVSSNLPAKGSTRYGPENFADGDARSAWVEGAEGDGVGEWIELTWHEPPQEMGCYNLTLHNGYLKSAAAYRDNGRVKALDVSVDGKPLGRAQLADHIGQQRIDMESVQHGQRVRLTIAEVYPGARWQDTAISEMVQGCAP